MLPTRNEDRVVAAHRDADARALEVAQRELAESERRLSDMLANVHLISLMLDCEACVTYCNDYFLRLTGWRREEVIGMDYFKLFIVPEHAHLRSVFSDLIANRPSAWHNDNEITTRSGERLLIRWNNTVLRSAAGAVTGVASIGEDITERARADEEMRRLNASLEKHVAERTCELEAANHELQSFVSAVTHDLRAPLDRMRGFSTVLLEEGPAADTHSRNLLERIAAAGRDMESLIHDLLELSTVTRGELRRLPVDLAALASEIAAERLRAEPGRQVDFRLAPRLIARADPGLLRIVMENLLGNAWKFSSRTPHARIEFGSERHESGERIFFVRDNGAGFDPARAGRLFAPFERLHSKSDFDGTGIGLATVQRIVNRHGGRVWAESRPGCGATFRFTLEPAQ